MERFGQIVLDSDEVNPSFFYLLSRMNKLTLETCKINIPPTVLFEHGYVKAFFSTECSNEGSSQTEKVDNNSDGQGSPKRSSEIKVRKRSNSLSTNGSITASPNGEVKIKNGKCVSFEEIFELFSNSYQDRDLVGTLLYATPGHSEISNIRFLTKTALHEFLFQNVAKPKSILQKFVRPNGKNNIVVSAIWTPLFLMTEGRRNPNSLTGLNLPPAQRGVTFENSSIPCIDIVVNRSVVKMINDTCCEIAAHFEKTEKLSLVRLAAYFKVDEDKRLFLTYPTSIRMKEARDENKFNSLIKLSHEMTIPNHPSDDIWFRKKNVDIHVEDIDKVIEECTKKEQMINNRHNMMKTSKGQRIRGCSVAQDKGSKNKETHILPHIINESNIGSSCQDNITEGKLHTQISSSEFQMIEGPAVFNTTPITEHLREQGYAKENWVPDGDRQCTRQMELSEQFPILGSSSSPKRLSGPKTNETSYSQTGEAHHGHNPRILTTPPQILEDEQSISISKDDWANLMSAVSSLPESEKSKLLHETSTILSDIRSYLQELVYAIYDMFLIRRRNVDHNIYAYVETPEKFQCFLPVSIIRDILHKLHGDVYHAKVFLSETLRTCYPYIKDISELRNKLFGTLLLGGLVKNWPPPKISYESQGDNKKSGYIGTDRKLVRIPSTVSSRNEHNGKNGKHIYKENNVSKGNLLHDGQFSVDYLLKNIVKDRNIPSKHRLLSSPPLHDNSRNPEYASKEVVLKESEEYFSNIDDHASVAQEKQLNFSSGIFPNDKSIKQYNLSHVLIIPYRGKDMLSLEILRSEEQEVLNDVIPFLNMETGVVSFYVVRYLFCRLEQKETAQKSIIKSHLLKTLTKNANLREHERFKRDNEFMKLENQSGPEQRQIEKYMEKQQSSDIHKMETRQQVDASEKNTEIEKQRIEKNRSERGGGEYNSRVNDLIGTFEGASTQNILVPGNPIGFFSNHKQNMSSKIMGGSVCERCNTFRILCVCHKVFVKLNEK